MNSKLADFLKLATPEQRQRVADAGDTSVAYLYQLAGGHRLNPSANIALGIEQSTTLLHWATDERLPIVTVEDLVGGEG